MSRSVRNLEKLIALVAPPENAELRRRATKLLAAFFSHKTYDREFALRLLRSARGDSGEPWALRRLAVLMLENQILSLPGSDTAEHCVILRELRLVEAGSNGEREGSGQLSPSLLHESYGANDLASFIFNLRERLSRLNRIHSKINSGATLNGLADFIHVSRQECKLTLGRYIWEPAEVVARIAAKTVMSRGVSDRFPATHPYMNEEAERILSRLPQYEREIIRLLSKGNRIYWVADSTPSELNSVIEYPLGTVVLVAKPPGSDVEIELKRAGSRGPRPMTVEFSRNGDDVPPSHRLYGGSMGSLLRWEAGSAALLSKLYNAVHGEEAPTSRTVAISTVYGVPTPRGEQHVLRYFTNSGAFGESGFRSMRAAMERSIPAFNQEETFSAPRAAGDLGLTSQFLSQVAPSQAILVGTTSFRLDRVALYLSERGPAEYFKGIGRRYTRDDARRLADDVLEEVLGVLVRPQVRYARHRQYVREALRMKPNRVRADAVFLSLMNQIGRFWGTLIGARGFSNGESFVARNVGLRSVWEHGEWRVKIVFMDHDGLNLIGRSAHSFHPLNTVGGMILDHIHIFGKKRGKRSVKGEVGFLEEIYQPGDAARREGRLILRRAVRDAYHKTVRAIECNPAVHTLFQSSFVERIRDWDRIVVEFLATDGDPQALQKWKSHTRRFLKGKRYTDRLIEIHFCAIERHGGFLRRQRSLYVDH
ncbi:MAG TPA: hypothetical protein VFV34_04380 [Blastocatellia bacterium]|nr:hypothetical protein [Blastocatellia bacterium]